MEIQQIIILIVGALLFTVSFFIPEKKKMTKENREEEEKLMQEALQKELSSYRFQMEEAQNEAIEHTKEISERYFERITNEKMMAISEYSDTVMEQIHKNHEEAVFLYDMLNNKHAQIKNTAAEINNTVKSAGQLVHQSAVQKEVPLKKTQQEPAEVEEKEIHFEPITAKHVVLTEKQKQQNLSKSPAQKEETEVGRNVKSREKSAAGSKKTSAAAKEKKETIAVDFGKDSSNMNSNDRILALHKEGKSNMAIARELGLGIGEVKLVIDLFEGI